METPIANPWPDPQPPQLSLFAQLKRNIMMVDCHCLYLCLFSNFFQTTWCRLDIRPWMMRPYLNLVRFTKGGQDDRRFCMKFFWQSFSWWEHQLLVGISLPMGQIQQNQLLTLGHIGRMVAEDVLVHWFGLVWLWGWGWEAFLSMEFCGEFFCCWTVNCLLIYLLLWGKYTKPFDVAWTYGLERCTCA